uniref:Si:dkey-26c10.5 n=1 Tax=Oryzias latipes TaxID=8090 RepID=H2M8Y5_ORYLA
MYLKFCRSYVGDKKDKLGENLPPELSVELEKEKELPGNARLYRAVCAFLLVICLILLAVVVILGMKLCISFKFSVQVCSGGAVPFLKVFLAGFQKYNGICHSFKYDFTVLLCVFVWVKHFLSFTALYLLLCAGAACEKCPRGWIAYRNYCYFLSTLRLNWDNSQSNCTKVGGSLAVIESQEVQNFLSKNGKLNYWIGLKQDQSEWKWNDNKMLEKSYWKSNPGNGDCALLYSRDPAEKNWAKISCQAASYYICQIEY